GSGGAARASLRVAQPPRVELRGGRIARRRRRCVGTARPAGEGPGRVCAFALCRCPRSAVATVTAVLVDQPRADVAVITLNRPERLNALTAALVAELGAALDALA